MTPSDCNPPSNPAEVDIPVGRFAPSPTGRMHLGNIFTALLSWLSVRSRGGRWILRVEDLDPQRSRIEYEKIIEDDLAWLGLDWDEGGLDEKGPNTPYIQSRSLSYYEKALQCLVDTGKVYRCRCRRADLHAPGAPHASDGRIIYNGHCRPPELALPDGYVRPERLRGEGALRLYVPSKTITFHDLHYGLQSVRLDTEFGDFVLRRADGAWAYQLAVVTDDGRMGVTEVVRGHDLLPSSAPQIYLYHQLGLTAPRFAHVPLLCNANGQRLSKRDSSLSMETLRKEFTPRQLIGYLGWLANLTDTPDPCTPSDLIHIFSWDKVPTTSTIKTPSHKICLPFVNIFCGKESKID